MNKLNIIIASYNRPELLNKLVSEIYNLNLDVKKYEMYVVNDSSTANYSHVINKFCEKTNFHYTFNHKNQGKNRCLYDTIKQLGPNSNICIMDDDCLISKDFKNIFDFEIKENECIGIDLYSNGKLIGDHLIKDVTIYDFYFKYRKKGDKLWIFNIDAIDLGKLGANFFGSEVAYDDVLWTHFLWKLNIKHVCANHLVSLEYLPDGVSKNIAKYKEKNPYTRIAADLIYFRNVKFKNYKLWYALRINYSLEQISEDTRKIIIKSLIKRKELLLIRIAWICLGWFFKKRTVKSN